jgi:hypothetical protein
MKIRLRTIFVVPALLAPLVLSTSALAATTPTATQIINHMETAITSHLSGTITNTQLGETDVLTGDSFGNSRSTSTAAMANKVVRWSHALVGGVFYLRMDGPTLSSQLGPPYLSSNVAAKYGTQFANKWLSGGRQSPKVVATLNWGTQLNFQMHNLVKIAGKSLVSTKPLLLNGQMAYTLTSPEVVIYVSEATYLPIKTILRSGSQDTQTIRYGHVARLATPKAVPTPSAVTKALTAIEVATAKVSA